MKTVLVPTDFSLQSRAALSFAIDLALKANAKVHVIHMIQVPLLMETTFGIQPNYGDSDQMEKATKLAREAFTELKNSLAPALHVDFKIINTDVVPGILEYVQEHNVDQIVMSSHGASGIEEFLLGSTAEIVVRHSNVPVISIPKRCALSSIDNIIFPWSSESYDDGVMSNLTELQWLLKAKINLLFVNTPDHFQLEKEVLQNMESFTLHYRLKNYSLNFRSNYHEGTGIVDFANEIGAQMVAMATHGRTGFAHLFKGSITEKVLNRIDLPIWTCKLKKHHHEKHISTI
jgi:nucleotide-binding universal stress UspA family protein